MELDEFLERNILEYLDSKMKKRNIHVQDREEDYGLYLTKDYFKELQQALENDEITRAKALFDELKDTHNRLPARSLERKKVYFILEKMYGAIESYMKLHYSDNAFRMSSPNMQMGAAGMTGFSNRAISTQDAQKDQRQMPSQAPLQYRPVVAIDISRQERTADRISGERIANTLDRIEARSALSEVDALESSLPPLIIIEKDSSRSSSDKMQSAAKLNITPPVKNNPVQAAPKETLSIKPPVIKSPETVPTPVSAPIRIPSVPQSTPTIQAPKPVPLPQSYEPPSGVAPLKAKDDKIVPFKIPSRNRDEDNGKKSAESKTSPAPFVDLSSKPVFEKSVAADKNAFNDIKTIKAPIAEPKTSSGPVTKSVPSVPPKPEKIGKPIILKSNIENLPSEKIPVSLPKPVPRNINFEKPDKKTGTKIDAQQTAVMADHVKGRDHTPFLGGSKPEAAASFSKSAGNFNVKKEEKYLKPLAYSYEADSRDISIGQLYQEGLKMMFSKKYPDAIMFFNKILAVKPEHRAARIRLAECNEVMYNG